MTTTTVKLLIEPKQLEATQTVQYTANKCKTIIDNVTITNTTSNNVTFNLNLVASGGTVADNNLIYKTRTVAPNQVYTCPELIGVTLGIGYSISTIASAANALTITMSGREITQ